MARGNEQAAAFGWHGWIGRYIACGDNDCVKYALGLHHTSSGATSWFIPSSRMCSFLTSLFMGFRMS